jgi:hypothetical protein
MLTLTDQRFLRLETRDRSPATQEEHKFGHILPESHDLTKGDVQRTMRKRLSKQTGRDRYHDSNAVYVRLWKQHTYIRSNFTLTVEGNGHNAVSLRKMSEYCASVLDCRSKRLNSRLDGMNSCNPVLTLTTPAGIRCGLSMLGWPRWVLCLNSLRIS